MTLEENELEEVRLEVGQGTIGQLPPGGSQERFRVLGPPGPIVAELGEDATLPCSLYPVMSAENMELRWFRSNTLESVFTYQDGQERHEELMAQYAGRTSLVGEFLSNGEAAVLIHRVQATDNGLYTCFFSNGVFREQASLELQVAGWCGLCPQVHIMGPEEDGVRVVCTASDWFPEPQVQWRDPQAEQFLEFSKVQAQDTEGLFSVEAALVVRDSSAGSVTCSIYNPVLRQEKAMAIVIPEPFFPRSSPWKPVFLVSLPLTLLLLLGAACYTRREHSTLMRELKEQGNLHQAKEKDRQTKEEALKDTDELQAILDQRKAAYLAAWRKAQMYAESFFPWASPWKPAFLVSLPLLLQLLLGAACYTQREHSTWMRELQEQRNLHQAKEEDRQNKEETLRTQSIDTSGSSSVHALHGVLVLPPDPSLPQPCSGCPGPHMGHQSSSCC
ncbi:butyrophilin subfamily 3 member A2-like [Talpa occidentalis]|uniref:butyrophilin subfamily 3 member A2-like n=1 Tax=Talpa occidentalis TaxID=50954 RepID=UPI0023F778E6|nr:butyrophilin subfamily 3 member A2-like [Talpa occidentalis]